MTAQNYTPIDNLIKKHRKPSAISTTIGISKEAGPLSIKQEASQEVYEAVEHEPEPEVKPYVNPRAETIDIPPDLKHFGLQPANNTQFPNYQNIKLPIPDEKIVVGLHAPITNSMRWLATLALYLLQKAHLGLKVIHGKVVRVIRS